MATSHSPRMSSLKKCMGWPIGTHDASVDAPLPLEPTGNSLAMDGPPSNYLPLLDSSNMSHVPELLTEIIVKPILEDRTLTTGILLALLIVFLIKYARSPWRKLPPSPRRVPVIGN